MFNRIRDRNIWLVFAIIFVLGIAYGISLSITALLLTARHFTKQDIGTLASWFAGGIVSLSLPMGGLIRRFSAKRTLSLSLAAYAVCVGLFPLAQGYPMVAAIRFIDGACSVGIWVSCETILLARADPEHKAFVTSLYAISMATGYILGPLFARGITSIASMPVAFHVAGVVALAAAALCVTSLDHDPPEMRAHGEDPHDPSPAAPTPSMEILWRIKTSCFATFAYGYFQASVVLFLPLFLIEKKGIEEAKTILIPAFFAAGMLLFSNYAGRLGDRRGHLSVMRVLAVIGTLMVGGFMWLESFPLMCVAIFVAGATLASISPVSLALQGIIAAPRDYSRSNAIYNAFYAAGMLLGPPISSAIYQRLGGPAMLGHIALLWIAFIVFTLVFRLDDPRASASLTHALKSLETEPTRPAAP